MSELSGVCKKKKRGNEEFHSYSKSKEELDLFFIERFYPEVYLWKRADFKEFLIWHLIL